VLVEEEVEEKEDEEEEEEQRQLYLRLELRRSFRFVSARVVRLHTSRAGAHLWCLLFGAALSFYYSLLLTFWVGDVTGDGESQGVGEGDGECHG
jgi:hypothetical protein